MRPELEHPRLRQNGRLVIGRYAGPPDHGVDPAWESDGKTCVMLGEDGRIYNVDPTSIRSTEPRDRLDELQETTVIVDHAEPELFEALDSDNGQVTLASPYLSEPVALRLAELAERSRHEWYLLTCLDPRAAANHYLSIAGLTRLFEAGVMIQHCPQLHAKAYVVGTSFAIIGSANLTDAGLGSAQASNLELSVTVPRPDVPRVQSILDQWWDEGFEVGQDDIDRLERQAAALPPDPRPGPPAPRPANDLDAVVDQLLNEARQDNVGLWIKTLYDTPDPAVALFHSLSDATRLAIVHRLACGEARVSDLMAGLGLAQSTVSAHVACLRDCGLVVGRPQGRQVFYSLARPELMDLLASAETLLAATGNAVALCPNYGTDSTTETESAEVRA